ncbi:MAG: hypothetical protein ACUZ8O_14745 [Candidatus Anammoxibacter sp.]
MKKNENKNEANEMRNEYDFSEGIQGKHYKNYRKGHSVRINKKEGYIETHYYSEKDGSIMLDPDVKRHFHDSVSVNKVLREYITSH